MPINVPETLYQEAKMIDKGIMPNPRTAYLTPTYRCNQACYYCFYKDWNNKGVEEHPENLIKIINELKSVGVEAIEFEGGGDPLMTENIIEVFEHCANNGIRIGVLSNGVLFKGKIAETILKYATYIRISLDTVDKELYKKIRGRDNCEEVIANIKSALELKKQTSSECQISIKVGISKEIGEREINDVFYYFDGWELYNIQVKNLWNDKGMHYRRDINRVELMRLGDGHTIPVVKKVVYPKYMPEQCWITPCQIATDIFGDFYLCVYYMYRKNALKVGNMLETPLKQLWGSDMHKQKIADLKISECLKHDCRFQKYMKVIRRIQRNSEWSFL